MRAEHPAYEAETVIRNGRVQGGLQPTRAFGDAVYKWTTAQGEAIADVFRAQGSKARPVRPWNFTPPYVTASPEVTYRSLHSRDEKLKCVVLATDGCKLC
jgi:pyruvate dehydrogenase phosphatase